MKKTTQPRRVQVWNGDKSEYLGEGTLVGTATVWIMETEDGVLLSEKDPRHEPDRVPGNCRVRKVPQNPKIVLDTGGVVYGCQVWWQDHD